MHWIIEEQICVTLAMMHGTHMSVLVSMKMDGLEVNMDSCFSGFHLLLERYFTACGPD